MSRKKTGAHIAGWLSARHDCNEGRFIQIGNSLLLCREYHCPNADCFAKAVASKGLERSFKMPIEKSVYDKLAKELENIEAG